ncbi:MAG TPA: dethiobiotin synthase [Nocardioides sp.]|nr:dethiobiotin synthase [Nocardioides sp.]
MSLYVVTGTDTGVGKTFVTSRVVAELRRAGVDAVGLKPVETGWSEETSDAAHLAAASGKRIEDVIWAHFALPAAPSVAAAAESTSLEVSELVAWVRTAAGRHEHCFVEGAGGWMVPMTSDMLFCEVVERLGPAGVILVSASRLGTINHTLLTAEAVQRTLPLAAVVLSVRPTDPPAEAAVHMEEISKRLTVPVIEFPRDLRDLVAMFHVEHQA